MSSSEPPKNPRVVIIDRDLEHADWLRGRSWSLPLDVDELLEIIGTKKSDVAKFMKLPAARAMPQEVRHELIRRKLLKS